MAVNADITLGIILQHKQLFFDLLDHAEAEDGHGADEFSISYYVRKLSELQKRLPAEARRRVGEALDTANLERCGLLNYMEERDNRLLLKPFVLDMIRHLDRARLKELSDAELNLLREQLNHARSLIIDPTFTWDTEDPNYTECIGLVISSVRGAAAKIRQNIDALHGQSVQLAKIVDDAQEAGISRTQQVEVALNTIFQITERHIKPTLLFLDPQTDWKGRGNDAPMRIIEDMMERFHNRRRHDEFASLNRAYLAMLNSAGRISQILQSLDSYLKMHDQQRKLYEGIERRYSALRERVQAMQDGKKKYRLKSSDEHFDALSSIAGLKDRKSAFTSKINWPSESGTGLLDEFLRVKLDRYRYRAERPRRETGVAAQVEQSEQNKRQRVALIARVASNITLDADRDIYQQIHSYLSEHLEDYEISEIHDAVHFTPGAQCQIIFSNRMQIESSGISFRYFERRLKDAAP